MKKTILFGFAFAAILTACNEPAKTVSQEGVYKLEKQVITDGKTELVKSSANGDVQYKVYTSEGYFYIGIGKDSSVGFGTGSYKQEGNTITETNIYNSGSHDTAWDAKLEITNNEKGFTQVIPSLMSGGVSYKDTEDYTKIEAAGTSALDGIWHQTKTIIVKGTDTVENTYNEYKVYSAGHFMWATKYVSDTVTKKMTTLVGHGTFTLNNDALTENLDLSNMPNITGKYDIKVKFNGADEYTQETADTVAKTIGFKTYKRIKK
jgi:hypothetical protein